MNCPKCGKKVSSEDYNCIYCGVQLKSVVPKEKKGLFGRKGKDKTKEKASVKRHEDKRPEPPKDKAPIPVKVNRKDEGAGEAVIKSGADKFRIVKIGVIAALGIAVIVLVLILIHSVMSKKGERYSEVASEYIGRSVGELNQDGDLFYADNSAYYGVNSTMKYDLIGESTESVKVQGIKYPEWAVTLDLSDAKFITDVTYTDFSVVKHDVRGVKKSSQVSLERFTDGDKQSSVLREIDMKPYSISYSQNGLTTYTYKYYYKRDNDDEQAVILRVVFTEKGKYRYFTSELLFPENM